MPMDFLTSPAGQQMLSYLPPDFYDNDVLTQAIIQVVGLEIDQLNADLADVFAQAYVDTSTEWGLDLYESQLGLPDGSTEDLAQRRSNVKAAMTGTGTITDAVLEAIAGQYEHGSTSIYPIYGQGLLIAQLNDVRGIPSNLVDFQNALSAKKPAHLVLQIVYSYFTWDRLDAHAWTWNQLDALNLTWDQLEVTV
jgi:Uncharacterised protein conserved in bacteria (DUF2313)